MATPGPVGRRLPGLGRRTASTWRPAAAPAPGRVLAGARRARWRELVAARGSRSASTSSRGSSRPSAASSPTARQREALVALGTLAAGLAHEINNPASAATRAVDALQATCDDAADLARRPRRGRHHRRAVRRRSTRCAGSSAPPPPDADPLAVADREDALSDWLDDHGVARGLAARAAARRGRRRRRRGASGWPPCSATRPLGAGPASGWPASLSMTGAARRDQGVDRRASRTWSPRCGPTRSSTGRPLQPIDVTEGLESTLVMLGHKLGDGVTRRARLRRRPAAHRGDPGRAQPGVDEPHRQRRRRDGRRTAPCGLDPRRRRRRGRRGRRHRPGHAARGAGRTRSSRSSRPRTSARAPASVSTSPAASSSSATTARSRSTPSPGGTVFRVTLPGRGAG